MLRRIYLQAANAVLFVGMPFGAWYAAQAAFKLLLNLADLVERR